MSARTFGNAVMAVGLVVALAPAAGCGAGGGISTGGGDDPGPDPIEVGFDLVVGDPSTDHPDGAPGDDGAAPGDPATADEPPADPPTGDLQPPDAAGDGEGHEAGVPDLPPDEGVAPGCPGGPWCPCNVNDDCDSGFCVDAWAGSVCSATCSDESSCPKAWRCALVAQSGGDPSYVCVDPFVWLCRPCKTDPECIPAVGAGNTGYSCLDHGPDGRFCTAGCVTYEDCPEGFACVNDRRGHGRCLPPAGGECPCTERFRKAGYETVCSVENAAGTCYGARTCDAACDARVPAPETCDGQDEDCDGETDDNLPPKACDLIGPHGTCVGTVACVAGQEQCQGAGATPEACNGADDDCDGQTDEEGAAGCKDLFRDADHDGWGVAGDRLCLCAPASPYTSSKPGDCDDARVDVHPGVAEVCNGRDDDCDGTLDVPGSAGCVVRLADRDEDGFGADGDELCTCWPDPPYVGTLGGDCDDADAHVFPGSPESCNGRDDDCDGTVDEAFADGCSPWFRDDDDDGFGVDGDTRCQCGPEAPYRAAEGGDCDDARSATWPGAAETCNGIDDDCDGAVDEGFDDLDADLVPDCTDLDDDGDGDPDETDCAPRDAAVHHGAIEACNGHDDDCDGAVDEADALGCNGFRRDADGDGYGNDAKPVRCLCAPDEASDYTTLVGGDCNDAAPDVHPGATESCNGRDDDCDAATDEVDASGCKPWLRDADRDGRGADGTARCLCAPAAPFDAALGGDCADDDPTVHPGAAERCNGVDDDCDGVLPAVEADLDGDGEAACEGDCDDANPDAAHGKVESCSTPFDDDCDGATQDEKPGAAGCAQYDLDADGDGAGAGAAPQCWCKPTGIRRVLAGGPLDCDDNDPQRHPGAPAVCGKDADCDGGLPDPGEPCDDPNAAPWDGCNDCEIVEFRVNTHTVGHQIQPAVASAPDGRTVVAWTSDGQDGSLYGIYAQRLDARSRPLGPEFRVNATTAGDQQRPSVAVWSDGTFVVAWQGGQQDGSGYGVWARRFQADGAPAAGNPGAETRLNVFTAGDQDSPRIAALAAGVFQAVWESFGQDESLEGVYTRRFAADGTGGIESRVNMVTTGNQARPAIATLADGRVVVAWESDGQDGSGLGLMARFYDANGAPEGPEFPIGGATAGDQGQPAAITPDAPGGRWLAWAGQDGAGWGIRLGGTGPEQAVNVTTAGDQKAPALAVADDGTVLVTWQSAGQDGGGTGVFARAWPLAGVPGGEFRVNAYTASDQAAPAVAALPGGRFIVVWQSAGQDGSFSGIYAARFKGDQRIWF